MTQAGSTRMREPDNEMSRAACFRFPKTRSGRCIDGFQEITFASLTDQQQIPANSSCNPRARVFKSLVDAQRPVNSRCVKRPFCGRESGPSAEKPVRH
jgi:hypothetical protein